MTDSSSNNSAVVLLSGGIDSTTALAIASSEVDECIALTFRYGQKHVSEVRAAAAIAHRMGIEKHLIVPIPLGEYVASALTSESIAIPSEGDDSFNISSIPSTYVPARNTIFLSYALAIAEAAESERIYIGVSSVDYSGYPDCRPEFIRAFQRLADLATKRATEGHKIRVIAPLQHLNKAETIKRGIHLGVDYSLTQSCYNADNKGRACERCDSCLLRRKGFEEANVDDPTHYRRD